MNDADYISTVRDTMAVGVSSGVTGSLWALDIETTAAVIASGLTSVFIVIYCIVLITRLRAKRREEKRDIAEHEARMRLMQGGQIPAEK